MQKQTDKENSKYSWKPGFKWLLKTFAVVYIFLIISFFALNFLLKPYMRQIPEEITPWLSSHKTESVSAEQK